MGSGESIDEEEYLARDREHQMGWQTRSRKSRCSLLEHHQLCPQRTDYPTSPPLTHQKVKSAFELAFNATLPDQPQVLTGRSWSGRAPIQRVDISTDGGTTWRPAGLRHPDPRHAWVRWEYPWQPPGPGSYTLQARATDWRGLTQPATVPFNTGGYLFWATVNHPVAVSP